MCLCFPFTLCLFYNFFHSSKAAKYPNIHPNIGSHFISLNSYFIFPLAPFFESPEKKRIVTSYSRTKNRKLYKNNCFSKCVGLASFFFFAQPWTMKKSIKYVVVRIKLAGGQKSVKRSGGYHKNRNIGRALWGDNYHTQKKLLKRSRGSVDTNQPEFLLELSSVPHWLTLVCG